MIIDLAPEHIEFATDLGKRRFDCAMREGRTSTNHGPNTVEMHINGAIAECVVYLRLKPIKWHVSAVYRGKVADLEDFIDAKAVQTAHHCLIVQHSDPAHWAYVLVDGSMHPRHEIVGWLWGHEAQVHPITDPHGGRPAHFIPRDKLHEPRTLIPILRKRQA
jgi:hypothetical protein